jgi:hypothetical protein
VVDVVEVVVEVVLVVVVLVVGSDVVVVQKSSQSTSCVSQSQSGGVPQGKSATPLHS